MRLAQGCVVLTLIMLAAAVVCGTVGVYREYSAPWTAAAVASAICWIAGIGALLLTQWATARFHAYGILVGMLVRMALPMVVGLALDRSGGQLSASHVFGMVVACYLVMLLTETLVSLRTLAPVADARKRPNIASLPGA